MSEARSSVAQALAGYGAQVRAVLPAFLPKGQPAGYLYDLLPDYPSRGGKMLRPSLCLAAARAFGASAEEALLSAVGLELLHNALLIHDDIEDESETRRGRPALHKEIGLGLALNVGDAMALAALRPLALNLERLGPRLASTIFAETERMAWETVEGQAMELGWRRDNAQGVTEADYLVMVMKKTCWLTTIYPLRLGGWIGARGAADFEALTRLGFFLGAAFQIQDDILNLEPDASYGKELAGDLYEGKRTLMLIHCANAAAPDERARLFAFLAQPREARSAEDVAWILDLMDRAQSISYARGVARGLAGAALAEHAAAFKGVPDSSHKSFIAQLASWIFTRD